MPLYLNRFVGSKMYKIYTHILYDYFFKARKRKCLQNYDFFLIEDH